jgi:hypothetical protein
VVQGVPGLGRQGEKVVFRYVHLLEIVPHEQSNPIERQAVFSADAVEDKPLEGGFVVVLLACHRRAPEQLIGLDRSLRRFENGFGFDPREMDVQASCAVRP